MNILVIAHYQDDGSPYVSFVHDQVVEFVKQGHQVIVLVPTVFGKKYKYLHSKKSIELGGAQIYYLDCLSFSNYGKYNINNFCGFTVINSFMRKLLKLHSIDVIHAHTIGFDGCIAVKLKQRYHIPVVITTHGTDTIGEINNGKGDYIIEICKKADCIVAVSSKLKKMLLNLCPELEIFVIMNGFRQLQQLDVNKEAYTIIQVSALIPQKGVDVTIAAFAKVLRTYPQARLEIVGEGEEEMGLKSLCKELDIEDSVCFCGFLKNEEVLKHMAKSQIFVMPSINEGFGIVYIEAMSQKCVVIGTRGEGIEDVIRAGENGFLISPNQSGVLAEIMTKCLSSMEDCMKIADKGFHSSQKLTWENNAKRYIELFEKLAFI